MNNNKAPEPKMMQASVSRAAPSQMSVAPSNISRPPVKSNLVADLDDLEDLE